MRDLGPSLYLLYIIQLPLSIPSITYLILALLRLVLKSSII